MNTTTPDEKDSPAPVAERTLLFKVATATGWEVVTYAAHGTVTPESKVVLCHRRISDLEARLAALRADVASFLT